MGLMALINGRRHVDTSSLQSKRMLVAVRSNVVGDAFDNNKPVDMSDALWTDEEDMPDNPAIRMNAFKPLVVNAILAVDVTEDIDLPKLQNEISALDLGLQQWAAEAPDDWMPTTVSGPECIPVAVEAAGVYGGSCEIHLDCWSCNIWNDYRRARIKLALANIKVAQRLGQSPPVYSMKIIQEMVDGICGSIPFNLGGITDIVRTRRPAIEYLAPSYPHLPGIPVTSKHMHEAMALGGWFLHRPMVELIDTLQYLRPGQADWIQMQLERLNTLYSYAKSWPQADANARKAVREPRFEDLHFPNCTKDNFVV